MIRFGKMVNIKMKHFWAVCGFLVFFVCVVVLLKFSPATVIISPLSSNSLKTIPTPVPTVTIGLVGDLGLGRYITAVARAKSDFSWSFQNVSSWLEGNDFNLANLESPIIKNCPTGASDTFIFCGDSYFLPYLKQNKFILSLANNHILNYGLNGLAQTEDYLSSYQIPFVYSKFISKTVNGITFGFLSYDLTTNFNLKKQKILDDILKYKSGTDWFIVALHWGNEYQFQPSSWQVNLAHELIGNGVDIIYGQHSHVWQFPEDYKGKKIYYSMGNFIFDQNWSKETSHSNIVRLTLSKDKILKEETFPIEIKFSSQPLIVHPTQLK